MTLAAKNTSLEYVGNKISSLLMLSDFTTDTDDHSDPDDEAIVDINAPKLALESAESSQSVSRHLTHKPKKRKLEDMTTEVLCNVANDRRLPSPCPLPVPNYLH